MFMMTPFLKSRMSMSSATAP